jgi:hypothetical protein
VVQACVNGSAFAEALVATKRRKRQVIGLELEANLKQIMLRFGTSTLFELLTLRTNFSKRVRPACSS